MDSVDSKVAALIAKQGFVAVPEKPEPKAKPKPRARKPAEKVVSPPTKAAVNYERFAHVYVSSGCNATEAYRAVKPGCTDMTAAVNGSRLLRNAKTQAFVEPLLAALMDKHKVDTEFAIARLLDQSNGSALDYFKEVGGELEFIGMDSLTDVQRRNVKSVKISKNQWGQSVSLTVNDQQKAVELLGRYLQMFTKEIEPEDVERIGDLIEAGVKRIRANRDLQAWQSGAFEGTFSEVN